MSAAQQPVFGPNDHNMVHGSSGPGLGDVLEQHIREARGQVTYEEPPSKAALRVQANELNAKAKTLSVVERELEKERAQITADQDAREAALAEREALVEAQLADLAKAKGGDT